MRVRYNHHQRYPKMSAITQHGYLVIADISGYTSFVAKTELEHSQEILSELLELLVSRFAPTMTISKLEGDAVFAYSHGDDSVLLTNLREVGRTALYGKDADDDAPNNHRGAPHKARLRKRERGRVSSG